MYESKSVGDLLHAYFDIQSFIQSGILLWGVLVKQSESIKHGWNYTLYICELGIKAVQRSYLHYLSMTFFTTLLQLKLVSTSCLSRKEWEQCIVTYRRDVLNRICSYIQWIAINTEQYKNIKSKYAHDECATNGRPGKLLYTFKWKAETLLNTMSQNKKKKKVITLFGG